MPVVVEAPEEPDAFAGIELDVSAVMRGWGGARRRRGRDRHAPSGGGTPAGGRRGIPPPNGRLPGVRPAGDGGADGARNGAGRNGGGAAKGAGDGRVVPDGSGAGREEADGGDRTGGLRRRGTVQRVDFRLPAAASVKVATETATHTGEKEKWEGGRVSGPGSRRTSTR